MANRSYLYSLDNRPASYADRPGTIGGLSEWPYDVPFIYRLLMSADPQRCASLISDGLDGSPVPLHAISAPFDAGFERVSRFAAIVKTLIALPEPEPATAAAPPPENDKPTIARQVLQWLGVGTAPAEAAEAPEAVAATKPTTVGSGYLREALDETLTFLEENRDDYLLLETVELDVMSESDPDALRALVGAEIERCRHVGAAFDALPADITEAAKLLRQAAAASAPAPLDAFHGLRFDDAFDNTRTGETECPLGLAWTDVLYFAPSDREEFQARE
ncbi:MULTISPECIES: hypothetical protein [unclassified Achromobacter]|uniref:DUF7822 domain-containing protein n=1 Tax=unclassified Achromobacter TaxID=2626865 RepID=UPI001177490C|nr:MULTISPECIES: hypothetical protein [unclassified Achromobacter]